MRNVVGVIAEYNPFHNGHAYHLSRAKALSGCAHAVVALSGSFVQRGEPAAFDKFQRACFALRHGADLVLELPTAFACASAERFARGSVAALAGTGLVSALAFGAEHADLALLRAMAFPDGEGACAAMLEQRIAFYLKQGLSFPAARAHACVDVLPGRGSVEAFSSPNNILAVEYLRALGSLAPEIVPIAIARTGAAHDALPVDAGAGFASASALRDAAERRDMPLLRSATPPDVAMELEAEIAALHAPKGAGHLSDAILYALRMRTRAQLAALPDVSEGLENTIYEAARTCTDYPAFLAAIKTKRYTLARLRRIAMYALLGVDKAFFARHAAPRYLRVLGVRRDALSLLSVLSEKASLPIVISYQDYTALNSAAKEQFDLDLFAGELLAMAAPAPEPAASEFSRPLLVV